MDTTLIDETKIKITEIVDELLRQRLGTRWAHETNEWAIDYIKKLTNQNGNHWYKGLLSKEQLMKVHLPFHKHDVSCFTIGINVEQAKECYKTLPETDSCLRQVNHMKTEIRENGFKSVITLEIAEGEMNHIDGLHRMLAVALLIDEGFDYQPIPVFLYNPEKK